MFYFWLFFFSQSCPELIQHLRWVQVSRQAIQLQRRFSYVFTAALCRYFAKSFKIHHSCFIREKNFEEFSKHLKGLVELYKLPGDK